MIFFSQIDKAGSALGKVLQASLIAFSQIGHQPNTPHGQPGLDWRLGLCFHTFPMEHFLIHSRGKDNFRQNKNT